MSFPKLDRSRFKWQSFEDADNQLDFWLSKSPAERLRAANYLICLTFGYNPDHPPQIDKTVFSTRKHPK